MSPFDSTWPAVQSTPFEAAYCVTSRRNDSLGARGRWQIFAALCALSFGLATGVRGFRCMDDTAVFNAGNARAFFGFPVDRPACVRLGAAQRAGDRVILEREYAGVLTRHEFNRCWTRLELARDKFGRAPHLAVCSAGCEHSFRRRSVGGGTRKNSQRLAPCSGRALADHRRFRGKHEAHESGSAGRASGNATREGACSR